jgi:acetyltransferase-like isoleucine patch superfamily enzyme
LMCPLANVRPGRTLWMNVVRRMANTVRSTLVFGLRYRWVQCKGMVRIPWNVELWSPHRDIVLGDRVQFGKGCLVNCDATFGNNILVARQVSFIGRDDHRIDIVGRTMWDSPRGDSYRLVVEDDVWIGHGAIVVSGVTIGRGSVIAAGAIVVNDIPRYAFAGGVPAKVISMRFTPESIRKHEELLGYAERTTTLSGGGGING